MARNGISYNDVIQAIDEMQSEGLNPTIAGLRERLGTGSFTTISDHLKQWRSERQQKPMIASGTPAPDNLNSMVQAVWQQAREDATKELESYKEAIQKTLEAAEAEKHQAIELTQATEERNRWLEGKNSDLLEEIRSLEQQNGALAAQCEGLNDTRDALNTELAAARNELRAQHERIEQLSIEHRSSLERNEAKYKEHVQSLQAELSHAVNLFSQQLSEERNRSESAEQHWIMQIDTLRQQLKERELKLDKQNKKHQQLSKEITDYNEKTTHELKQIRDHLDVQNLANEGISSTIASLTDYVADSKAAQTSDLRKISDNLVSLASVVATGAEEQGRKIESLSRLVQRKER